VRKRRELRRSNYRPWSLSKPNMAVGLGIVLRVELVGSNLSSKMNRFCVTSLEVTSEFVVKRFVLNDFHVGGCWKQSWD